VLLLLLLLMMIMMPDDDDAEHIKQSPRSLYLYYYHALPPIINPRQQFPIVNKNVLTSKKSQNLTIDDVCPVMETPASLRSLAWVMQATANKSISLQVSTLPCREGRWRFDGPVTGQSNNPRWTRFGALPYFTLNVYNSQWRKSQHPVYSTIPQCNCCIQTRKSMSSRQYRLWGMLDLGKHSQTLDD
jgi:hypothetical protein